MRVAYAALLLSLLTARCAHLERAAPASEPPIAAAQPDTPKPAAEPSAPSTPQPAPADKPPASATPPPAPAAEPTAPAMPQPAPAAKPPAPATPRPAPAAPPTASAGAPAAAAASQAAPSVPTPPAAAPALDLNTLGTQLKETKAIGLFTKITLKNQVDDLLDRFREFYDGKAAFTMGDLRQSFDLLMMKVLTLLQDVDQRLASAIVSSREAIWGVLADSEKFATVQS